jgi:DUF1680 family protein
MFCADDRCRPGYTDPRQAVETCAVVEMMRTFALLATITGDPVYADRCEDVTYNTYPATLAPDGRSCHALTAPNMVQLDGGNKSPAYARSGSLLPFDPRAYPCCTHNAGVGWAWFSEHLWMATPGNGLATLFFAPSEVRAKVGDGVEVSITVGTGYPFNDTVEMKVSTPEPVRFPWAIRIPGWCHEAKLIVNGEPQTARLEAGKFAVLERTWQPGDLVRLELPMTVRLTTWKAQKNAVSVHRGPLTYSLRIREKYKPSGDMKWPKHEVTPETPWNYALYLNSSDPAASFKVEPRRGIEVGQKFYFSSAPWRLETEGYLIPEWTLDSQGLIGPLRPSPVRVDPVSPEEVTLIPMGCARLRVSVIPTAAPEPEAHPWVEERAAPN